MTTIRAKFRCMSLKTTYDGYTEVVLRAVMGNKGSCEENKRFWESTPNGEATFTMRGVVPFESGAYYYIDMEPNTDSDAKTWWQLYEVKKRAQGCGGVNFQPQHKGREDAEAVQQPLWGSLTMDITRDGTLSLFGEPGPKWRISFSRAPDDDPSAS